MKIRKFQNRVSEVTEVTEVSEVSKVSVGSVGGRVGGASIVGSDCHFAKKENGAPGS